MQKEPQKKLLNKYPKIFRQHSLPCTETAMCWGVACGDGWYKLLDMLCSKLQFNTDNNNYPQVEAVQVKEKYGGLRFYYSSIPSYKEDKWAERHEGDIEGTVAFAEYLSESICEICGSMDGVTQTSGWVYTKCKKCLKKGS